MKDRENNSLATWRLQMKHGQSQKDLKEPREFPVLEDTGKNNIHSMDNNRKVSNQYSLTLHFKE